ncbi:hypothetical protein [Paenibacillus amylolyticus]|uniref:hypothetical protein n=1 Tax=Paenibacillus amylolyticus TaxID=1451 RepID=UPI00286A08A7|nr:hypothetical protein [Paenibacillus amylolyticus]
MLHRSNLSTVAFHHFTLLIPRYSINRSSLKSTNKANQSLLANLKKQKSQPEQFWLNLTNEYAEAPLQGTSAAFIERIVVVNEF